MEGPRSVDPLEELRRANPAPDDELPSASLARVRARVMGEPTGTPNDQQRRLRRAAVRPYAIGLAGVAAAIAVAIGALNLQLRPGGVPGQTDGPPIGMCVEVYSLESLRNRTFAFDGTVTAVSGDDVTFEIGTTFKGVATDHVIVTASGMTGGAISPTGGVVLRVGERFLVSGDGDFAWGCGFTQLYDVSIAAQWAAAFGQ